MQHKKFKRVSVLRVIHRMRLITFLHQCFQLRNRLWREVKRKGRMFLKDNTVYLSCILPRQFPECERSYHAVKQNMTHDTERCSFLMILEWQMLEGFRECFWLVRSVVRVMRGDRQTDFAVRSHCLYAVLIVLLNSSRARPDRSAVTENLFSE